MLTRFKYIVLALLLLLSPLLAGQGNPFELTERLAVPAVDSGQVLAVPTDNPFDLLPAGSTASSTSFAPARAPSSASSESGRSGPLIIQPTDPNKGKGRILTIHLILLLGLAALWLTVGDLLRECLRGMVNDGLMNQLYNRRSGGALGAFWACYVYFWFVGGFFLYLVTVYYDVSLGRGIWLGWLTYSLVVAAALGLKNFVLTTFARLFPVEREMNRYMFAIMVFTILAGLFLAPLNLLISYAPEEWRATFIYAGVIFMVVIYGLHLLRGGAIANRLLASRPVHILLYLCAVEIAPLLLIYRYLGTTLA